MSIKSKKTPLFIIISLFFTFIWGVSWGIILRTQKVKGINTTLSPSQIIALTNLERSKLSLPTLSPNQALNQAALSKAQDMFSNNYFNHLDNNGNGSWNIIEQAGYTYNHAGENLARNFSSSEDVVQAWMQSQSHKNNLLSQNYTDIGVAVVESGDQVYIVQLLASPLPEGVYDKPESGSNFIFSSPISGNKTLKDSNLKPALISFLLSLSLVMVGYKLFSFYSSKVSNSTKPNISHWQTK